MMRVYPMRPCPAPRQSRRDVFKPRPAVQRYHAFRDEVRIRHVQIPQPYYHVLFVIAMPRSWSKAIKDSLRGMPHQHKPDKDNLEKALLDSVFGEDQHIWDGRASKVWGDTDLIAISAGNIDLTGPVDVQALEQRAQQPYTHARELAQHATHGLVSAGATQDTVP